MLSIDEALQLVLSSAQTLAATTVSLDPRAVLGCVLAEAIVSDIDSPPHDKAIVDGYAVIAADVLAQPAVELAVLEEVTAGALPTRTLAPGTATRIMTGAPLPAGADAVVMVEQTELRGERVRILQGAIKPRQNIMGRAASLARGQTVLAAGQVIRPIEMGLLAEVGRSEVQIVRPPSVMVIATGNELVSHRSKTLPGPGQIRDSNSPLLCGLATRCGAGVVQTVTVPDERDSLQQAIAAGLERDVLLLSGGVSMGVLDLVPQALADLGVEQVFHKVNLKPGKPLWFGMKRHGEGRQTIVFGLPGNPVSGLVCFELFVRPALEKLRGRIPRGLRRTTAALTRDHQQRGERPTYWPAVLLEQANENRVTPLPWQGSGDLRALSEANCLAYFPPGDRLFQPGERIELLVLNPDY